ncbi:MAG: cyclase family protein [Candidatus Babeliales bacterium]|jgi:arylformamidase|nr:MAG: Arylformamidase [candidate division TM6 bacterium GW2011_GWF2_36_6]
MKKYKVIDISWPINQNTVEYRNKGELNLKAVKNIQSDDVHQTHVSLDMHTGTHIDAPMHFSKDGNTVDSISFDHLISDCKVFDLTHVEEKISASDLQKLDIQENDIVLFKTKNSFFSAQGKFEPNFVYLDKTAAQYLVSKKIKTVGIDYLGVERAQPDHETHKIFFNANITIIEGLRLGDVNPGKYFLICLPVKFEGVEAALSRAVLLDFV